MTSSIATHFAWQTQFEDISSFSDDQVAPLLAELKSDISLLQVIEQLYSATTEAPLSEGWHNSLDQVDSIADFQDWIEHQIFPLIRKTFDKLTSEGLEDLDPQKAYIFISNHRDIIMDPLLLNLLLKEHKFSTAHCAIGDNLLKSSVANSLARLNNCFKVIRSLKSPKAILRAMKTQSAYIGYRHFVDGSNIWIAQKEGRSKDNSDVTNPALIKMLCLSRPKSIELEHFLSELNIVPVCYSYEWDPCDIDKANQLEASVQSNEYKKDNLDDLIAVQKGLMGAKGRIHVQFGTPITVPADRSSHTLVANKIDEFIQSNYQLFPVNYAAYKKLYSKLPENCTYSKTEINQATKQLEERMLTTPKEIQKRLIQAYAAPLISD